MHLDAALSPHRAHSVEAGDEHSDSSGSDWLDRLPKLGNFAKLHTAKLIVSRDQWNDSPPDYEQRPSCYDAEKPTKLGDFKKLFTQFQAPPALHKDTPSSAYSGGADGSTKDRPSSCHSIVIESSKPPSPSHSNHNSPISVKSSEYNSDIRKAPLSILKRTILTREKAIPTRATPETGSSSDIDTDSEFETGSEADPQAPTPASTPPTSVQKHLTSKSSVLSYKSTSPRQLTAPVTSPSTKSNKPRQGLLFSYQVGRGGPAGNIYEQLRTREEKHASLTTTLAPHRALDATMAAKYPAVASHGTHVFVDMSNIDIGFQNALKARYDLDSKAHISPLPHLNLHFLTEVLVRARPTVALNVGCSIVPGRTEPRYVQELRNLGYRVDLRERKRVEDSSAPEKTSTSVRYVEDLVDETLQTRIAESVMEHFQGQGTIVLATGDAKPAQYSDGFFTYVERALKMGWNVEVVSWKGSLSSTWRNRKWKAQWNDRFRVIELDHFLDNLVACCV